MGSGSPDVEAIAASHRHDLYLLTSCDLPFVQDGLRDGETIRQWMTKRFEDVLTVLSAVSDGFKSQVAVTKGTPQPFPRLRNSLPKAAWLECPIGIGAVKRRGRPGQGVGQSPGPCAAGPNHLP